MSSRLQLWPLDMFLTASYKKRVRKKVPAIESPRFHGDSSEESFVINGAAYAARLMRLLLRIDRSFCEKDLIKSR